MRKMNRTIKTLLFAAMMLMIFPISTEAKENEHGASAVELGAMETVTAAVNDGRMTQEEADFYTKYATYIESVCDQYDDIDRYTIISMIETESWFTPSAKNGSHYGLMQVSSKWHKTRMKELGCTDLYDPYENIQVGVDVLADCLELSENDMTFALMIYNQGYKSAKAQYGKSGASTYASTILERADRLRSATVVQSGTKIYPLGAEVTIDQGID